MIIKALPVAKVYIHHNRSSVLFLVGSCWAQIKPHLACHGPL